MRVAFAGTPPFAARALEAIIEAGFDVPIVLTPPDRPRGRGLALAASAVKTLAAERGLPLGQPASLTDDASWSPVRNVTVDVLVVAAYGLLLAPAILRWPRHGCLNIHASLLPRWRGAAPVQRALLAGDPETGITIMQMDEGLDTGPIVLPVPVAIAARDTAGDLLARLGECGARTIVTVLERLARDGALASVPQPTAGATYAVKITRAEAGIDWTRPAVAVDRQIRAFDPAPGAFTAVRGMLWKVWRAEPTQTRVDAPPGTLVHVDVDGIVVACGEGAITLRCVQPAGGKRLSAGEAVAGRRLQAGDVLG